MSLADEGTAVRIASCSRCAKGAEQPLAESTCSRVYRCSKVSRTRASSSCSVMRRRGRASRASLLCSRIRLIRSSPTSSISRREAWARCWLSAPRAPRNVDSVMPPAETDRPRSATLRYAGRLSRCTVIGKHAEGTRKSAASAGATQPGQSEGTKRLRSSVCAWTCGRGSRRSAARVIAASSRTRSIFSVTCWHSSHAMRWQRRGSAARSSSHSSAVCKGGARDDDAVVSRVGGSARRSSGIAAAIAASRTQLPTSPRLSIW
mmetsp:Transcript_22083/g.61581  ORF Transcript_22083/g.61581 Transcript_22083/m.61581 type:complete len:262 (+) Transcript_22083:844-1629(+)